jgi:outer membrane protein TolC
MKRLLTSGLICLFLFNCLGVSAATPVLVNGVQKSMPIVYKKNARTIHYAFVFDGPSAKNEEVLKNFKKAIVETTAPDYKAGFSANNVYIGNWSNKSVQEASEKALKSNVTMVVSLGYLSTKYFNSRPNKNKFVVTIDQYGLRDLGGGFFNPVQQSVKGIQLFERLIPTTKKAAILMNESFYKTRSDWDTLLDNKLKGLSYKVIPVNNNNIDEVMKEISAYGADSVVMTPLFNLSEDKRHELIDKINAKKLPSFSTIGKDDVKDGILMGAGAYDLDRKIAEATSFSIKGVLNGAKIQPKPIQFYEDQIVYLNKDTADLIGYDPHLRLLNNSEIITNKKKPVYSLSTVFDTLDKQNLDIQRKRLLVTAAQRASLSAILRYLPTLEATVGYQQYNYDYADSARILLPEKTGVFSLGVDQVIYSPALVTNILVKKKMVDFSKDEKFLTEQNMGIDIATLYLQDLIFENMVEVQKENVLESRENLAIARVREQMGKCGKEEAMRWATQLFTDDQEFLDMKADLKNIRININKLLDKPQSERYSLAPLRANDPSFFTSEINIIDYVSTPKNLESFTEMLVNEAYKTSPELAKLRAAKKMKEYERSMYLQKFILPDAKLSLAYTSLMNREFTGDTVIPAADLRRLPYGQTVPIVLQKPDATNLSLGIFAQWKPIEGGTKFAEISRINNEIKELDKYDAEVHAALEQQIRGIINKAIAGYFSIEKDYKAMYAAEENYKRVQALYLKGDAPIEQMMDAQNIYKKAKLNAMNAQNEFFKQLIWVQRAICAVDWAKASPESKDFIKKVKNDLQQHKDIEFL